MTVEGYREASGATGSSAGVAEESGLFARGAAAFAASVPDEPVDDGFFGPGSVTWRLHADLSAPVSGLRSLLLQALHPLAMAGVDQHSQWRADVAGRFASTSAYVLTTTYGDRAAARHESVRGTDPVTGHDYAAGDPDLLIWVHAALVDSGLVAADLYGVPLSAADADAYVAEMTAAAELVGVPAGRAPASVAELDAYFTAVRPELIVTPAAAATAAYLIQMPEVEPELADIWRELAAASIASLPDYARQMYGLDGVVAPPRENVRQVLGVLDAIVLGEPGVLEARQRITLRMRAAGR